MLCVCACAGISVIAGYSSLLIVCVCVCACVRAYARVCMRACVHACVCV